MISFEVTAEESTAIATIATRAASLLGGDVLAWEMDITALHANHCPLRLADLASASDFNFVHDCIGISNHIDRSTGTLTGHFSPRYSA